jgi:hypothetical protein
VAGWVEGFAGDRFGQWRSSVPAMVAQGDFFFLSGSGKRAVLGGFVSWCGGKRVLGQSGRENFSTGLQIFFADPR